MTTVRGHVRQHLVPFRIVRQKLNGQPLPDGLQCVLCEDVVWDIAPGDQLTLLYDAALEHECGGDE